MGEITHHKTAPSLFFFFSIHTSVLLAHICMALKVFECARQLSTLSSSSSSVNHYDDVRFLSYTSGTLVFAYLVST